MSMLEHALDVLVCPYCCGCPQVVRQEALEDVQPDKVTFHFLISLHCPECEAEYGTLLVG